MFEKLQRLEVRYNELEGLLSSQEVLSDREKSNKLAKELSDIKEPVALYREHKRILKETQDLEAVLKDKHDQEFLDLAKKELEELKLKQREIEEKIKGFFKNIIKPIATHTPVTISAVNKPFKNFNKFMHFFLFLDIYIIHFALLLH